MGHSSRKSSRRKKPVKPRKDFPLFPTPPGDGPRRSEASSSTSARLPTILRGKPLWRSGWTRRMIFWLAEGPGPRTGN